MPVLKSKNQQNDKKGKPALFQKTTKGRENAFDVGYAESDASVMSDTRKVKSPKKPAAKPVANGKAGLPFTRKSSKPAVFNVEYAESEASVMSKTKTPENKSINDSIDTDLTTESIHNFKKNLIKRKESQGLAGFSFLASDESDDDDVLRRDVRHTSMHATVTNPAVNFIGKEDNNMLQLGNKSIHTEDWVNNVRRQSEYSEIDEGNVTVTEAGLTPTQAGVDEGLQAEELEEAESPKQVRKANSSRSDGLTTPRTEIDNQSLTTDMSLTPSFLITGKKMSIFNKPKNSNRMNFSSNTASDKTESNSSPSPAEPEKTLEDDIPSSQDNSLAFIPPKRPFSRPSTKSRRKFEVSPNETAMTSQENSPAFVAPARPFSKRSQTKSKPDFDVSANETVQTSQENSPASVPPKPRPFTRTSARLKQKFDVSLNESAPTSQESSPPGSALPPKRPFSKRPTRSEADFNVSANETGPTSQESSPGSVPPKRPFSRASAKSKTNFNVSREETFTSSGKTDSPAEEVEPDPTVSRKTLPFTRRTTRKEESFEVAYEESDAVNDTQQQNSSPDITLGAKAARGSLFTKKSTKPNGFDVDFEKTQSTPKSPLEEPEFKTPKWDLRKEVLNRKRPGKEADTFNVSFEETTGSFENSGSSRKKIFGKKSRKDDDFNVTFEETRRNETLDETDRTVSQEIRKAKEIFLKKLSAANFEVSANETIISSQESNVSTGAKKKIFQRKTVQEDFETPDPSKNLSVRSKKSVSDHSPLSSIRARNSSMTMSDKSKASGLDVTVIDKTEKSIRPRNLNRTASTNNTSLGEISYNDDNLNDFMSDSSAEEEEERLPSPKLPPPKAQQPPAKKSKATDAVEKISNYEDKFNKVVENAKGKRTANSPEKKSAPKKKPAQAKAKSKGKTQKPPTRRLKKPADYATPRLYNFLIDKLKPNFGLDANVKAEDFVVDLCETVKMVLRRKQHQKKILNDLKMEMAKLEIIETTIDFYNFIREYLPHAFRLKSVPSIQPFTNIVWPPEEIANPAEKIL